MDENEKIDEIKEKLLDTDVRCSMVIKNLVESYDILNNIYQEEI